MPDDAPAADRGCGAPQAGPDQATLFRVTINPLYLMGSDIHLYIEHKRTGPNSRWSSFGGRFNPGRYYGLFAKLAGVRNYREVKPVAEPRGMPADAGWIADADNRLYISEDGGERHVTAERA